MLKLYQRFNHYPGMQCLANKENLGKNLNKLKERFPAEYNFFPKTWVLPENIREFTHDFVVRPKIFKLTSIHSG